MLWQLGTDKLAVRRVATTRHGAVAAAGHFLLAWPTGQRHLVVYALLLAARLSFTEEPGRYCLRTIVRALFLLLAVLPRERNVVKAVQQLQDLLLIHPSDGLAAAALLQSGPSFVSQILHCNAWRHILLCV